MWRCCVCICASIQTKKLVSEERPISLPITAARWDLLPLQLSSANLSKDLIITFEAGQAESPHLQQEDGRRST